MAMQSRQEKIKARVLGTLKFMTESDIPINFQSVARHACVSKTWLYKHAEINNRIKGLRNQHGVIRRTKNATKTIKQKDDTIMLLNDKVKKLGSQVKDLKQQLELAYAEIFKLKNN